MRAIAVFGILLAILSLTGCESDTAVVFVRSFSFNRDMDRGETVTRADLDEKEIILTTEISVVSESGTSTQEVSGSELENRGDELHITDAQLASMLGRKLVRDISRGTRLSDKLLE